MEISNAKVAKMLRNVAAAYTIKGIGNVFQIRAYENAADSIENSTAEIRDLWQEGKLSAVPNLGEKLQGYLDELLSTGKVKHFESIKKGIPVVVFDLLDIPGVGPKTAARLADLGVTDFADLRKKLKSGDLQEKGFSPAVAQNILEALIELKARGSRKPLHLAFAAAERILDYMKKSPNVLQVYALGSLRREVATVGDLDFAVSSNEPQKVVDYFCHLPQVAKVVDQGHSKATVVLQSGWQADLLVGRPESFGALLQHFTGSKAHNIKLREIANKMGYSLSEYGVRKLKAQNNTPLLRRPNLKTTTQSSKLITIKKEEELYEILKMQTPPPELREDTGEIEAALAHKLPDLVKPEDIKGDLHLHSNYPFPSPSHAPGVDSIEDIVKKGISLGYEYIGIADHPPGVTKLSLSEISKVINERTKVIRKLAEGTKSIHILNGLEIDILADGTLSVPDEALATLDFCLAGIHSGHRGSKEEITKRVMNALQNPHVDIISHPTNRLINERESSDADWEEIFTICARYNKILEINAHPVRLDLRDDLVRQAKKYKVKFIINTDAHEVPQMDNMRFGVAVARRGWATKEDIVNTWDWTTFAKWFKL